MFDLSLEMLRVVEDAAVASARTMGMGDANASDQAAVESMRRCLDRAGAWAIQPTSRATADAGLRARFT